jgi:hypothetical protein
LVRRRKYENTEPHATSAASVTVTVKRRITSQIRHQPTTDEA